MSQAGPPRAPAAKPPAAAKAASPPAPPVTPRVPPVGARQPAASVKEDDGWDSPTQVKDDADRTAPRAAVGAQPVAANLSAEAREQVWAIVRAAVDEAVAPLRRSLAEAEARLMAFDARAALIETKARDLERRPAASPAAMTAAVVVPPAPVTPRIVDAQPASAAALSGEIISMPTAGASPSLNPFMKNPSRAPMWKDIGEDATGLVRVSIGPPADPLPGSDRSSPLPGDLMATFDAGRKRKRVAAMVVIIMLLAVGSLVVAMAMSYR